MKKAFTILMAVMMMLTAALPVAAEETKGEKAETEIIVFAAASMTETLTEIAELYKEAAPNVTLIFNFDSSGTL